MSQSNQLDAKNRALNLLRSVAVPEDVLRQIGNLAELAFDNERQERNERNRYPFEPDIWELDSVDELHAMAR